MVPHVRSLVFRPQHPAPQSSAYTVTTFKMFARSLLWALATVSSITPILAAPTLEPFELEERATCTKKKRLAGAELIIYAYNLVTPGASAANFEKLPLEQSCHTYINPNGGPPILVANDKSTTIDFAINTRQVFSKVTGAYTDYANNDTTVIHTNVVSTHLPL